MVHFVLFAIIAFAPLGISTQLCFVAILRIVAGAAPIGNFGVLKQTVAKRQFKLSLIKCFIIGPTRLPSSTKALLVLILSTMSNTVRDVQQEDPATTEGLDELFADTELETADSLPTSADSSELNADILTADAEIIEWLTTTQAAALLGKSERTIQRYAKAGKLKSRSDESGKLFVAVVDTVDSVPTPADDFESVADNSTTYADSQTSDNTSVPTSADSIYDKVIDDYRGQINELQRKLEGASFQLGRMQAEIEHKDAEIKLLTDSQSKSGWWVRFTKWFFGQ